MKIVVTRSMLAEDIQYIKDGLDESISGRYELVMPEEFTEECICKHVKDADVLLGPFVTRGILDSATQLKLIQIPWTGMDTFDFAAVRGSIIPVCNTHSNADSVAELGVAIILDLLKKVSYHDRKMRAGNWNRDQHPLSLKSRMLSKQTVCVLGFGSIGSKIGQLVSSFGAKVIAVDDHAREGIADEIFPSSSIIEAAAKADVIVSTLPLTEVTRGLINRDFFTRLKDGALLVNMSRAPIVEEDALWEALVSGNLGGFGSDLWWNAPKRGETESYPSAKHEFWKLDNVVMSPHRAGYVEDCLPHLDGAIENLTALELGKDLKGIVDTSKGF